MSNTQFFIYLAIMAGITYLIRTLPFALFTKKIENERVQSFLAYIPYAVLAAMTVPSVFYATSFTLSAAVGLLVAAFFAMKNKSLTFVAVMACVAVFFTELIL